MSFWDLVNEVKSETTGSVEISTGFEPIPDGTTALAHVVAAKWKKAFEREDEFLEMQWEIVAPDSLKGRKFFNKHWVKDEDSSQKDEAKRKNKLENAFRVFANIDYNAGGKIVDYMSRKRDWPTEDNINVALIGKDMLIHVKEWEMNGSRGNWISAVWAKGAKETKVGNGATPKPAAKDDGWGSPAQNRAASRMPDAADMDDVPW